jgi:hypothetical protein
MSEDDPLVGDQKVPAIFQALGGSSAEGVKSENLGGEELAVEAVSDSVAARGGDHQPQGVNGFAAMDRDYGECAYTRNAN